MRCDELVAMVDAGGLAGQPAETVYEHVDQCPTCAELIAKRRSPDTALSPTLPAGPDSLSKVDAAGLPPAIGRYQVQGVLGAGGMGIVYAAWDPQLRRRVAIKLVRPERAIDRSRQQLLREARALARISHPNVVTAHDAGEHEGEIFVATELVAGETLAAWYAGRAPGEIVAAWIQAARGLAAAHAEGVVHRDVKPSNVLVGSDGRVRIGDFGLAHEAAAGEGGFFGGTPGYMAPEHEDGRVADARSDQFSLCVSIAETLTGTRPGAGARLDIQPPALAAALERGLRADPAARFPSVTALADALAAAVAPRRRRWPLALAAAAVLAVGAGGAWMALGGGDRGESCAVVEVPPDLWPAARRSALGPGIAAQVDAWLASWTAVAEGVCTAGRPVPGIQARQRACLSEQLTSLRALLDSWGATPPPDALQALSRMEEIGLPSRCSPPAVAGREEPSPAQKAEVDEIRAALAAVKAEDVAPALDAVAQLVARARRLAYAPLVVEALGAQAGIQAMSDLVAARRIGHEAVAAAGRDRYARVLASIELLALYDGEHAAGGASLAEATRAELHALGGDPALEAQLDYHLGTIWSARRDLDQSIAAYERSRHGFSAAFGPGNPYEALAVHALAGVYMGRDGISPKSAALLQEAAAMYQRAGIFMPVPAQADDPAELIVATRIALAQAQAMGPDSVMVFRHIATLADAYTVQGDNLQALEHYLRAIEMGERLGVREARLASAMSQAAAIAAELGRVAEGVSYARRAVALADEIGAESDSGSALTILGWLLLETGQPAEARIHLARALGLREKLREPGRFRGRTRYLLATALWPTDRRRARELAFAARVDIQADIDSLPAEGAGAGHVRQEQAARLAEIDAWLRAHR